MSAYSLSNEDDITTSKYYENTKITTYKIEYTWKISSYSYICKGPHSSIWSKPFHPLNNSNFQWKLMLQPNNLISNKEYSSIFLELISTPNEKLEVKAEWQFSILYWNDGVQNTCHSHFFEDMMKVGGPRGKLQFVSHEELLANKQKLLPNDTLTLLCKITTGVYLRNNTNQITITAENMILNDYLMNLSEDYEKLLSNQQMTDVDLICQDGKIGAHKSILITRSPVFAAMFENNPLFQNLHKNKIEIEDVKLEVLKEMLRFLYSGKFIDSENITEDLLIAAEKYQISYLKKQCEKILCQKICVKKAVKYLTIAVLCKAEELKLISLKYTLFNLSLLKETEEFKKMLESHPILSSEIINAIN